MKKGIILTSILALFLILPLGAMADSITIYDDAGDQIGGSVFDTTQITYNQDSNPLIIDINTNYTPTNWNTTTGQQVGNWLTKPADILLWGDTSFPPAFAIPLVDHDGFTAGTLYQIATMYTSDDIAALNGISSGYIWGFGEDVWLKTGTSTGFFGNIAWDAAGVTYTSSNWYWTSANPPGDNLNISWATATCANDVVRASVPEPATMLLLGSCLVGLAGFRKRFLKK